jgi:hypothetical protein
MLHNITTIFIASVERLNSVAMVVYVEIIQLQMIHGFHEIQVLLSSDSWGGADY